MYDWRTWLTITSVLFGAFGLAITWVNWDQRKLVYQVSDQRTTVFEQEESERKLTAYYNGKQVDDDVTAVQIAVWNEGDHPIRRADILGQAETDNLTIEADEQIRILNAELKERSRDVTGFNINLPDSTQGIRLDWEILEDRDGGLVQILFSGDPQTQFEVKGKVLGQGKAVKATSDIGRRIFRSEEQFWAFSVIPFLVFYFLSGLSTHHVSVYLLDNFFEGDDSKEDRLRNFVLILAVTSVFTLWGPLLLFIHIIGAPTPPF